MKGEFVSRKKSQPRSLKGEMLPTKDKPLSAQSLQHITEAPRRGTEGQAVLKELDRLAPQNKMSLLSPWGRKEGGRGRGKSRERKRATGSQS